MACNLDIFMDVLCQEFGFKFENARKYIKTGINGFNCTVLFS